MQNVFYMKTNISGPPSGVPAYIFTPQPQFIEMMLIIYLKRR